MQHFVLIGRYVYFGFTTRNWKTALMKRSQVRSNTTFRHLIKRNYIAREVVRSTWRVLAGPRPLFENASLSLAQRSFIILLITLHTELNKLRFGLIYIFECIFILST